MVDELGRMLGGSEDASRRIFSGNVNWNDHFLAVLMVPVQRHGSPDQLLICLVVQVAILTARNSQNSPRSLSWRLPLKRGSIAATVSLNSSSGA